MKKQDLDALRELYSSVYGGEFLLERRQALPGQSQIEIDRQEAERARQAQATNRALQSGRTIDARLSSGLGATLTGQRGRVALNKKGELEVKDANPNFQLDKTIQFGGKGYNRKTGPDGKVTYVPASNPLRPAAPPRPTGSTTTPTPTPRPTGSTTTPTPRPTGSTTRPTASGPVLSKKNGVEGTGIGANFKPRAFTDAEKSRYASVAAQNAARTSASSGTSKPAASTSTPSASPKPAIGKLGNTSFERRTPTSAELRAAQGERERQKNAGEKPNAEKALQAAQKTNLPTQGPTPAIPDLKSVNTDLAKANSPAVINRPAPVGTALAAQQAQQKKPPTPGTGAIMQKQSYEWPSAKTIRDIADAYASIYEGKKKDQDGDKDKDFADVMIARMMASGMSRAEAIAAVRNKEYNEEYQIYEIIASYLLENNFAETLNDANVIIENMSEVWLEEILEQSAIASRTAKVVDDQRQGYHGDSDAINKLQDAASKSIGKLKRGQGPVVTPGMPVRGV